ncbi:putative MYND-type zinc finger protein samB [Seiridium cardinale]|uniref:MYND-type zinc finger protein samB n=1 Tax=Seiridium cardinale TaxID=138064 RepID=A0ABR2XCH6_9PEZI
MGRWGMRLFEGDQDMDIVFGLNPAFEDDDRKISLSSMVHQTDILVPEATKEYYKTDKYKPELADIVNNIRVKLDSGKCDLLFDMYRAKENEYQGKYQVIILGALMMRAGAKIRPDDLDHLRKLVPAIHCSPGYALPIFDEGFRGPGKAQLLAALDHYKPGTPRDFQEPSCYECGMTKLDLEGEVPMKCSKCDRAWYCNKVWPPPKKKCQKAHWKAHKPSCIPVREQIMINV